MRVGTVKDACQLLLCSDDKVYEMAAAGEIPTLRRVGGQLRFDMDALESWLRGKDAA